MNMTFKTLLASGLAATLCAPAALAQQADFDPYGYVGADIGYFRVESEEFPDDDDNVEDNRTSYRLRVGGHRRSGSCFGAQRRELARTHLIFGLPAVVEHHVEVVLGDGFRGQQHRGDVTAAGVVT